jgi:glycosyltransferase involved in cell wall biosynthesis
VGNTDALVSICIPVLNGAASIEEALDSALAQSYEPIEIVVADDHSSDGTAEVVQERYGSEVRLVVNGRRAGLCGNHNIALRHCQGEFIKFLHHDDTLAPECVAKMADALQRHGSAGFVFSRRALQVDLASQEELQLQQYEELHRGFSELERINDGRVLLGEWLAQGFPDNWIGEPVTVMVRRIALTRAGLFSPHLRQLMDIDLWMRILAAGFDAAFLDEELATYRPSGGSSTGRTVTQYRHWLDPLWILEDLTSAGVPEPHSAVLERLLSRHRRMAFRSVARSALAVRGGYPVPPYLPYLLYRTRRAIQGGRVKPVK